jgi:hypothetical protein
MRWAPIPEIVLLLCPSALLAELPVVEDVPWPPLREQCRQLLQARDTEKIPLSADTVRSLQALVDKKSENPQAAARAAQELLDAYCLLGVSINPESRVKAARGPAAAELRQGQESIVLIRVHNEAGVTSALHLRGPQIVGSGSATPERWLRAELVTAAPFAAKLNGQRLEYRLLRLTTQESGKREATFQFDVGQGTQDLGFRAEVPVLFTIRKRE